MEPAHIDVPLCPSVKDFDYPLPMERIATHPKEERDESKLLVYKNEQIIEANYKQIDEFLDPGALLVFNNTRVVQARLHFRTSAGATVEIFCLEPDDKRVDVSLAMHAKGKLRWKCLVGELRKWKEDKLQFRIVYQEKEITLSASLIEKDIDAYIIEFAWTPSETTFAEILEIAGKIPLPPYIKRELTEKDKENYQTIYALHEGSVAAPTAGLHFTEKVFNKLRKNKIDVEYLTLHVGAGTFKPIKSETVAEHEMHSEQFMVEKVFVEKLIGYLDKGVIAVGTTSLRTLESLYWLGVKIHSGAFQESHDVAVGQWDPYALTPSLSAKEALETVITYLEENNRDVILSRTQLLIIPGYKWKIVNILATNFHQPKSTLVMLVASFIGRDWRKIYNYALQNDYRFLSYGDGSLLFRQ